MCISTIFRPEFLKFSTFHTDRPAFDRNFHLSKIFDCFQAEVLNLIFGKNFGKFCKTFGSPKPLFFGIVSTVERPGELKDWESRKAEIFWPIHCLTVCLNYAIKSTWVFSINSILFIPDRLNQYPE